MPSCSRAQFASPFAKHPREQVVHLKPGQA
jgi:hypothetical protein